MSLFERLGEKVEEFKQEAETARDEAAPYGCRDCGNRFYREQETCPECGSAAVVVLADEGESGSGSGSGTETEPEAESDSELETEPSPESEPEPAPEREREGDDGDKPESE